MERRERKVKLYKRLNEYLSKKGDYNFKKISLKKGEKIILKEFCIIEDGELEVFLEDRSGKHIKLKKISKVDCFIGALNNQKDYVEKNNVSICFICRSDTTLKVIPSKFLEELMGEADFNSWFFDEMLERMLDGAHDLFIRNIARSDELIKFLLKKESDASGRVEIDNISDFVEKHAIGRSTFYKGVKDLIKNNEIKRKGKKIQIID